MSDPKNEREEAVKTLGIVQQYWKEIFGSFAAFMVISPIWFYGFDMIAYPWAHGLTGQSPQGQWTGEIELDEGAPYLVNMALDHDVDLSGNQSNTVSEISGIISICTKGSTPKEARIYGDPSWTGSAVTLFSKIDFGTERVPERMSCTAAKDRLECLFDFEQPISNASRKFREEFKKVYTPKPEYDAKILVKFVTDKNRSVAFSTKCSGAL